MSPWTGFTPESALGIPQGLLRGMELMSAKEKKADVSVTRLIAPIQSTILAERHPYLTDADEQLWAIFGKALHEIMAQGAGDGDHVEETIVAEIDGVSIEGTPDLWDHDCLTDFKTTSVYSASQRQPVKDEWVQQVNLYAHLLRTQGWEGTRAQAVVLYRDWRPSEAKQKPWYPEKRLMVYPVPLWDPAQVERFLTAKLDLWKTARIMSDEVLADEVPCTDEETWNERRCQSYCPGAPHCHQWARRNADAQDPTAGW